jgi:hypothetical protein
MSLERDRDLGVEDTTACPAARGQGQDTDTAYLEMVLAHIHPGRLDTTSSLIKRDLTRPIAKQA